MNTLQQVTSFLITNYSRPNVDDKSIKKDIINHINNRDIDAQLTHWYGIDFGEAMLAWEIIGAIRNEYYLLDKFKVKEHASITDMNSLKIYLLNIIVDCLSKDLHMSEDDKFDYLIQDKDIDECYRAGIEFGREKLAKHLLLIFGGTNENR